MQQPIKRSQTIDSEITRIYRQRGYVKPSIVLEEATPEKAPLHDFFEWNDQKAGHEYRLIQSRKIIRVARVTVNSEEKPVQLVHVPWVELSGGREGTYKPPEVIAERLDEFTAAMSEAMTRLNSAERAVKTLDRAARRTEKESDTIGLINIALQAMTTATETVKALVH